MQLEYNKRSYQENPELKREYQKKKKKKKKIKFIKYAIEVSIEAVSDDLSLKNITFSLSHCRIVPSREII